MRGNVVRDKFRTHEDNITIRDKKIRIPAWGVELTQFAFVDTKSNHWLPRGMHQFFEFREDIRVRLTRSEWLVIGEPSNRTKQVSVFYAEVITLSQVIEVSHDSIFEGLTLTMAKSKASTSLCFTEELVLGSRERESLT